MPSFTVRIGALLVVLGVASYVTTGATSLTALIPAVVGAVLAVCGLLARRTRMALPVALAIAMVGLLGTITALGRMGSVLMTGGPARPALVARASMAVILLVYAAVAVRGLAKARSRS